MYCIILYCSVLYCSVMYCTVLYRVIRCNNELKLFSPGYTNLLQKGRIQNLYVQGLSMLFKGFGKHGWAVQRLFWMGESEGYSNEKTDSSQNGVFGQFCP